MPPRPTGCFPRNATSGGNLSISNRSHLRLLHSTPVLNFYEAVRISESSQSGEPSARAFLLKRRSNKSGRARKENIFYKFLAWSGIERIKLLQTSRLIYEFIMVKNTETPGRKNKSRTWSGTRDRINLLMQISLNWPEIRQWTMISPLSSKTLRGAWLMLSVRGRRFFYRVGYERDVLRMARLASRMTHVFMHQYCQRDGLAKPTKPSSISRFYPPWRQISAIISQQ
jgi:hypothetical protein